MTSGKSCWGVKAMTGLCHVPLLVVPSSLAVSRIRMEVLGPRSILRHPISDHGWSRVPTGTPDCELEQSSAAVFRVVTPRCRVISINGGKRKEMLMF